MSFQEPTKIIEVEKTETQTISEKIFEDSLKERTRISQIQNEQDFETAPKHPNQCSMCPRSFKKPSDLIRHIRTHTKEKPFKCDECGKAFTVVSTLNTHKKIHTRPSKYFVTSMTSNYFIL